MIKFTMEQDEAAQPPEPPGEKTPDETEQRRLERESGELLLDETMDEIYREEDPVEWDGSEAELVADEDAEEYEEQNTGIQLKYTLKQSEIFQVMMKTQYTRSRITLSVIASLLGIAAAITQFVLAASGRGGGVALGVICLAVVAVVVPSPVFQMRGLARKAADGREIKMTIYPDHIEMGGAQNGWEIPLDGTTARGVFQELIVLYIGSQMVILPLRCVEPIVLPEVQATIISGTHPA